MLSRDEPVMESLYETETETEAKRDTDNRYTPATKDPYIVQDPANYQPSVGTPSNGNETHINTPTSSTENATLLKTISKRLGSAMLQDNDESNDESNDENNESEMDTDTHTPQNQYRDPNSHIIETNISSQPRRLADLFGLWHHRGRSDRVEIVDRDYSNDRPRRWSTDANRGAVRNLDRDVVIVAQDGLSEIEARIEDESERQRSGDLEILISNHQQAGTDGRSRGGMEYSIVSRIIHRFVFPSFILATCLVIGLIFGVPLRPENEMRLVNVPYALFTLSVLCASPFCVLPQFYMLCILLRPHSRIDLATDHGLQRRLCWSILAFFCLMAALNSLFLMLDFFPFPFTGAILGSVGFQFLTPTVIYAHFASHLPQISPVNLRRTLWALMQILFIPVSMLAVEQVFVVGMYLAGSAFQLLWVALYQVTFMIFKLIQRIVIRKATRPIVLDLCDADRLLLMCNFYMELVLQLYVVIVSPSIHEPGILGFFLAGECISLAMTPILDTKRVRSFLISVLVRMFPQQKRGIKDALTIRLEEHRVFSIQNCALNFYVRVLSSLCYLLLGSFIYYGYNHPYFPTFTDRTQEELYTSFAFAGMSFLVAVIQYGVTCIIIRSTYGYDMHKLWRRTLRENFLGFIIAVGVTFCQILVTITEHYHSTTFLIELTS